MLCGGGGDSTTVCNRAFNIVIGVKRTPIKIAWNRAIWTGFSR